MKNLIYFCFDEYKIGATNFLYPFAQNYLNKKKEYCIDDSPVILKN